MGATSLDYADKHGEVDGPDKQKARFALFFARLVFTELESEEAECARTGLGMQ